MEQTSITSWAAIAQPDLEKAEPLREIEKNGYNFLIYNTQDSIWLTVNWPSAGSIAFRLAFGLNGTFDKVKIKEEDEIVIKVATKLGKYKITLNFIENDQAMFRYTTTFKASFPFLIRFWPRDIVPLTKEGRIENTAGKIHTRQVGSRSGQIYFSMTKPKNGSVFYFQNLSAISPFCEACEASLADSVGGEWPEIGFQLPANSKKPVPAGREFTISDAFVRLTNQLPDEDIDLAQQFLEHLAAVYTMLPKPETTYRDWPVIAENALNDLYNNKGCWTQTNGVPYLNAYVEDYDTPAEIMVQLAVLVPLQEYLEWKGEGHGITNDLDLGLSHFYDDNIKSIVRWLPSLEKNLDESEEQKKEMVMDSWYLHHPLLNLARLTLKGDKTAEKLFLGSVDYTMKVAKHFNYDWPVFYKMTTLEVLKAETAPGKGGEKDVPGSYAHVMLMAFKITGDKKYIREAARAVKSLEGLGLDIFYQANNTAFTAGALVELYLETGDEQYLGLSYCCLAGIFKNVQLWECDYGNAKHFQTFFGVFPLNDAPYTAAYEEMEVYAALHHYLSLTKNIPILPSLKVLIPEFIKYAVNKLHFYYPPQLPEDIIAEEIKTGEVNKNLWIPLEDLHDGWDKNGEVGQEVYGAGVPFGIVPRQYFQIKGTDMILFCDYPSTGYRISQNKMTFQTIGNGNFKAFIKIIQKKGKPKKQVVVEQKVGGKYESVSPVKKTGTEFLINAGVGIRITWK